ncbi:MAG: hypothetical protein PUF48_03740 [Oscillospiraceae bacterium]|nr:hypothetical protein [Oscillospiraceae bacterium]
MTIDRTLLDLERVPTSDELKAFFNKHDWSAAKLSEPEKRTAEKTAAMNHIKGIMNKEFEKLAREKGMGAASKYFENEIKIQGDKGEEIVSHQGNPLLELRDNTEDLIADAVYEIAINHDDIMDIVFSKFDPNAPNFNEKAQQLLHGSVDKMMDTMSFQQIAEIVHEMSDSEDFNPKIFPNYRAEDHERKWNHTNTKHPIVLDPELGEKIHSQNPGTEAKAIANVMVEEYWKTLDEKDKIIIKMSDDGYTQDEIAKQLSMANNSGISKRINKLKKDFERKTGIDISKI